MPNQRDPYIPDLGHIAIDAENPDRFHDLLTDARNDYNPRNFGERHLTDELAITRWRQLRVHAMQSAIFEEHMTHDDPDAHPGVLGDMLHLSLAWATEKYGIILAALTRLEARYQRQFNHSLRLLTALQSQKLTPQAGI